MAKKASKSANILQKKPYPLCPTPFLWDILYFTKFLRSTVFNLEEKKYTVAIPNSVYLLYPCRNTPSHFITMRKMLSDIFPAISCHQHMEASETPGDWKRPRWWRIWSVPDCAAQQSLPANNRNCRNLQPVSTTDLGLLSFLNSYILTCKNSLFKIGLCMFWLSTLNFTVRKYILSNKKFICVWCS